MGTSLRLSRVVGVEVGLNWSWLVVFALLVWMLATGFVPSTNPSLGGGAHLGMAFVATALFFCSLRALDLSRERLVGLLSISDLARAPRVKTEAPFSRFWTMGGSGEVSRNALRRESAGS
jgi:hypothetical protein